MSFNIIGSHQKFGVQLANPWMVVALVLAFLISSTMLPSRSDQWSWLPVILIVVLVVGLMVLMGAGGWMYDKIAGPANEGAKTAALVFGISLALSIVVYIPARLLRGLLSRRQESR